MKNEEEEEGAKRWCAVSYVRCCDVVLFSLVLSSSFEFRVLSSVFPFPVRLASLNFVA